MPHPPKRRIMITVDVEAQPRRAERDPVDRLIWGKFPQGRAGIGEMMDIADRHGAKLTMFLDFCERDIHGEAIRDVGREIHRRGHDLQLHAHPDFMSNDFWAEKGLPRIGNLNETTPEQAAVLFDFLAEEYELATGERPLAYRGGGYRFNQHSLDAMAERGIMCHSSYNAARDTQPVKLGLRKQFRWPSGVLEVPVSCVGKFRNLDHPYELNFNGAALSTLGRVKEFLDRFHHERGEDAVVVMVMHSWSLLAYDKERGWFTGPDKGAVKRFGKLLKYLSGKYEVITARDFLALVEAGEIAPPSSEEEEANSLGARDGGRERALIAKEELEKVMVNSRMDLEKLVKRAEELWNDPEQDPGKEKSVALFEEAFRKGEVLRSAYRLGSAYYYGYGVDQDYEMAYKYFSMPELDNVRYARYFRGLILSNKNFSGYDLSRAVENLEAAAGMGVDLAREALDRLKEELRCPICQSPRSAFKDERKRKCPKCTSLERQRIFMKAYIDAISLSYDLEGKKGLLVSPSQAERRMMEKLNVGVVDTLDIRPEVGVDIVADVCDLPGDMEEKYDFVFASYVFTCVHDLDCALKNVAKVLKPGGILISVDPMVAGAETEEYTDLEKITSWYGKDNYEKYKVGSFRRLGEKGFVNVLTKYFDVQKYRERDPVTGTEMFVFVSSKTRKGGRKTPFGREAKYVKNILRIASENERNLDCEFSRSYYEYLKDHPGTTYSQFAVRQDAESVAANNKHATLGANISETSKRTGLQTYSLYRNLLNVRPDERVVEYGCGSLRVGVGFIRYLDKGGYFGLDVVREFFDIGVHMVGEDIIREKDVRFHVIDEEGIKLASEFAPDAVFASAVIFHIHPDEILDAFDNLTRIAAKDGARLIFDAKVTRNDEPYRYEASDGKSGWAWPLDFYREGLRPLDLVGVHKRVPYDWDPAVDFAHLEFRNTMKKK